MYIDSSLMKQRIGCIYKFVLVNAQRSTTHMYVCKYRRHRILLLVQSRRNKFTVFPTHFSMCSAAERRHTHAYTSTVTVVRSHTHTESGKIQKQRREREDNSTRSQGLRKEHVAHTQERVSERRRLKGAEYTQRQKQWQSRQMRSR